MKNPGRVWRDRGFLWREFSADDAATTFCAMLPVAGCVFPECCPADKWHVNVGRVRR